jgi:hypothetical protein
VSGSRSSADAALDDALAATFPASDPPANTVETGIGGIVREPRSGTATDRRPDDGVLGMRQPLVNEADRQRSQATMAG